MRGTIKPKTLKALMAEWSKLSPNIAAEPREGESPKECERRVRIEWATERLKGRRSNVESFNVLTDAEAKFLIRCAREESGDGPAYRAKLIALAAAELWPRLATGDSGPGWDEMLRERCMQRFRVARPELLAPNEARVLLEELISRIARDRGEEIRAVRERLRNRALDKSRQKSKVESQKVESPEPSTLDIQPSTGTEGGQ